MTCIRCEFFTSLSDVLKTLHEFFISFYSRTSEDAKKEAIRKIVRRFDKLESPRKEGIKEAGNGL